MDGNASYNENFGKLAKVSKSLQGLSKTISIVGGRLKFEKKYNLGKPQKVKNQRFFFKNFESSGFGNFWMAQILYRTKS